MHILNSVIPAQAGIHSASPSPLPTTWMPVFTGMTDSLSRGAMDSARYTFETLDLRHNSADDSARFQLIQRPTDFRHGPRLNWNRVDLPFPRQGDDGL
jgi:hypothetical protein